MPCRRWACRCCALPGVEADDVIGTLAQRAGTAGLQVLISTGDKDMAQLVNEHVTLVNTMTNSSLDRAGVKVKFDVYPEQIVDYLALVGDASDNIPGVPKVGPKTAAKWLNEYRTLDNLLAHQDRIEGKVGESLRALDGRPRAVARAGEDPLRRRAGRRTGGAASPRAGHGEAARAVHTARTALAAEVARSRYLALPACPRRPRGRSAAPSPGLRRPLPAPAAAGEA